MGVSIWEGNKAGAAVAALERQNLLLTQLIQSQSEATPIATLNEIAEIVRRGEAQNVFNIGDQINVNWNNGQNDYVLPFDITHFGDVQLQDGETIYRCVLEDGRLVMKFINLVKIFYELNKSAA